MVRDPDRLREILDDSKLWYEPGSDDPDVTEERLRALLAGERREARKQEREYLAKQVDGMSMDQREFLDLRALPESETS